MKRFLVPTLLASCASIAAAQSLPIVVQGNWQPPDMANYFRAELMAEGDHLRLRIFDAATLPLSDADLTINNPRFMAAHDPQTGGDWLRFSPDGTLVYEGYSDADGVSTAIRIAIVHSSAGISVTGVSTTVRPSADVVTSGDRFWCEGASCQQCSASIWDGDVMVNGVTSPLPDIAPERLLISNWTPDSADQLGLCATSQ